MKKTITACYDAISGKLKIESLWFLRHLCVIVGFALRKKLMPKDCIHDVKCILMYAAALNNPALGNKAFQMRVKQTLFVLRMAQGPTQESQKFVVDHVGGQGGDGVDVRDAAAVHDKTKLTILRWAVLIEKTMDVAPKWLESAKLDVSQLVQPVSEEDFGNMKSSIQYLLKTEFTEQ
ncbi:hypothetical protein HK102_006866, partial [Quaeritorhiza haematococci]